MTNLSDIDQKLIDAVRKDDLQGAKDAIGEGANVNARGVSSRTPLYYAAACARSAIVQLLLDHKADPNLDDDDGQTPLHMAVIEKKFTQAETLLEGGANIDFQYEKKATPLHTAFFEDLRNDETERSEFLIKKGADITSTMQRSMGEWTVFEIAREQAARFGHAGVILAAMMRHLDADEKVEEAEKQATREEEVAQVEDSITRVRKVALRTAGKYKL